MNKEISPLWDLTPFFSGFDDPEYIRLHAALRTNTYELISKTENSPPTDKNKLVITIEEILKLYNSTGSIYEELFSFCYCVYSTDTSEGIALNELNRVEEAGVGLSTFRVRFRNYLAMCREHISDAVNLSSYLKQFEYFFEEELLFQKNQMSPEMEELAADLSRSGADSWAKLQQTLSSSASAVWDSASGEEKTAVELRALAFSPDETVRKKAWILEQELWKKIETPMAFALNGVKGFSVSVNSRRNYKTTLERSVRQSRISEATLDSLVSVLDESLPVFRRYLKLKARLLGKKKAAFYDLFAPVGAEEPDWSYSDAAGFIVEHFNNFSEELGVFAAAAFENNWIDARPRKNKVGGAYCTGFHLSGVSRILCNFNNTFSGLSTMAHELGHAYHNSILKDAPEIYRDYPMTLAETASIFSETIVLEGALKSTDENSRLALIEQELSSSTQTAVDILSRFIFEKSVFERRTEGELSAADFCALMTDAQKQTYGDGLDENYLHPYMWAVKGHYYIQDLGYYNYPYAFGKLLGLGLYSLYKTEGKAFNERYKKLLYLSGSASAEDVVLNAGFDISRKDFWRSSINLIKEKVSLYEKLVENRG